jgi:hypothetical protein
MFCNSLWVHDAGNITITAKLECVQPSGPCEVSERSNVPLQPICRVLEGYKAGLPAFRIFIVYILYAAQVRDWRELRKFDVTAKRNRLGVWDGVLV